MRYSLVRYIFFSLVGSLVVSTVVLFYLSDKRIHSIVDTQEQQIFKERLDTIIGILAESNDKLRSRAVASYGKELKEATLQRINKMYSSADFPYTPVICDNKGKILYKGDYDAQVHLDVLPAHLQPLKLEGHTTSYENGIVGNFWIIKGRFEPWQWDVIFIVSNTMKNSFAHNLRDGIILLVILANIVLFGIGSWMIVRLGKPLSELKDAVHNLSRGKFDAPIESALKRKDEIGIFANGFQKMRESIKTQMTLLAEVNSALQTQVNERLKIEEERKNTELSYQQIFNASNEAIFIFDLKTGKILEANDAVISLFGYSREELDKLSFAELHIGPGEKAFERGCKLLESVVETGPVVHDWHCTKKSGQSFPSETSLKAFRVGDEYRVIVVCRDVSARRKDEQRRKEIEELLQRSKKLEAVGTLAGGIAHDFNNILTPIIGYAEMLLAQEEPDRGQVAKGLKVILDASLKAKELVLQILAFSRGEKGEFELISLGKITEDVVRLMRSSLPSSIKIEYDVLSSDCLVLAESNQLLRIITNLCANAQQAIGDNQGTISLGLEKIEHKTAVGMSGEHVHLWVKDDGCGIPADIIDRIFEPYFTTRQLSKGTGLGLSIVHGIVKNLDGEISVETVVNRGTIFHVYLPCSTMKENNRNEIITTEWLRGDNEVILIVDDEENVLKFEKSMFEQLGYQVFSFTEGHKAIEFLQQHYQTVDLVVTDMVMPSMSGVELAAQVDGLDKNIPVILLSGDGQLVEKGDVEVDAIVKILQKPIVLHSFASTVKEVLGKNTKKEKNV